MHLNRISLHFQMRFEGDVSSCQGLKFCIWNCFKSEKCLKGSYVSRRRNTSPFACSRGLPLPELLLLSGPSWQAELAGFNETLLNKGTLCLNSVP